MRLASDIWERGTPWQYTPSGYIAVTCIGGIESETVNG